jgi:hypothetical protein
MKDDKEHIDQLFESLNDRQFDIPEAFLEDLNKRLDNNEPKKRKYILLWFLLPLASLGAIAAIYFQNPDSSKVKQPVNPVTKMIAKDEYTKNINTPDDVLSAEQNQNNHHYPADSVPTPKTDKSLSAVKQIQVEKKQLKASAKGTNQNSSSNQISLRKEISKTQNDPSKKLSKRLKIANKKSQAKVHVGKQTKGRKSHTNGTTQKSVKIQISKSKKEGDNFLNTGNSSEIPDKISPSSNLAITDNTPSTVKADKDELPKEPASETKTDSTQTPNSIDTVQKVNSDQGEKDKTKPKTPAGNWKKEMLLFAGLGGNSIQDSPKNSEYLAKINQNRTSILAPSFGVNANLSYKKFTFGTGINYMQTGEKFKVDIASTVAKDSTYSEMIQDTVWVQDTSGVWIPILHDTTIFHTVQYMDSTWMSRSVLNRYSWISIPLHFGYRFELGDYELIPRIGAVFNFGIAQGRGTYPNASFSDIQKYRPAKFTVSYLIQFEARRNFDKWFVFINPYFQSMINPSVSGDVIRRRYTSWGMQFGVGLKL